MHDGAARGGSGGITAPGAAATAAGDHGFRRGKKGGDEPVRHHVAGMITTTRTCSIRRGELAAIGTEKFAMPVEVLKDDIQWIIANGKDIAPLRLGVKYVPVRPEKRKEIPSLGIKALCGGGGGSDGGEPCG